MGREAVERGPWTRDAGAGDQEDSQTTWLSYCVQAAVNFGPSCLWPCSVPAVILEFHLCMSASGFSFSNIHP